MLRMEYSHIIVKDLQLSCQSMKGGDYHVTGGGYMSKSYKKYPVVRQEKVDKKYYNRKLRQLKTDISYKCGEFKKLYVCDDWHYQWTREEAIRQYLESDRYPNESFPTLESWLQYCEKCTKRK